MVAMTSLSVAPRSTTRSRAAMKMYFHGSIAFRELMQFRWRKGYHRGDSDTSGDEFFGIFA